MAEKERAREDGVEAVAVAVAVVTPNDSHVPISTCFLRHGIHVLCDKPLANRWPRPKRCARSWTNPAACSL